MTSRIAVCDVCDEHGDAVKVLRPGFRDFGGVLNFHGPVRTVRCFEDNTLVGQAVRSPGQGAVLVVDGGGSLSCSLFGGKLAAAAAENGWAGVIVEGAVRDADELETAAIGIKALGLHPRATLKRGVGEADVPVVVGGQRIEPGNYLYADRDGVVVAPGPLHAG